jgi:hypothetical protein
MNWADQLIRIRRWVRDPAANIFSEPFLRLLYNDEQSQLYTVLAPMLNVQAILTHPEFVGTYTHDWEWMHLDHESGNVYQVGQYYDAADYVYFYVWEPESIKGYNADSVDAGSVYTHPWEAWMTTPHYPPPIPLPDDFNSAVFLAHDRQKLYPETKSEIISRDDMTWKTRTGPGISYWRDAKNNNWIRIYPLPSITWYDDEISIADPDTAEYVDVGEAVTFGSEDAYFGTTLVRFDSSDDANDTDNNILIVYNTDSTDMTAAPDESTLPEWMQKYIEYGVAARALRANTDGRVESLADYWDMRKKAGYEVIKRWKRLKMSNRNIVFRTRNGSSGTGQRPKHPRLPSTYADNWI